MGRRRRTRTRRSSCSCTRAWARSRCGRTIRRRCARRRARAASCTRATGYGHSTPRPAGETLAGRLHAPAGARRAAGAALASRDRRAAVALRAQRRRLDRAPATRPRIPARVAGVVAVAPHVFVEDVERAQHRRGARTTYGSTDLRARLARYHDDPGLGVLGLERHLARPCVSQLEHRGRAWPGFAVRCWPCRARTTSTARWRRSRASRARVPQARAREAARLRPFAASRPAGGADRAVVAFLRATRGGVRRRRLGVRPPGGEDAARRARLRTANALR